MESLNWPPTTNEVVSGQASPPNPMSDVSTSCASLVVAVFPNVVVGLLLSAA